MNEKYEVRTLDIELRAEITDEGQPRIVGVSPVYNQRTHIQEPWGEYDEIIKPGALTDVLKTADVRARYNHDLVLGRTKNGTLTLRDAEDGVHYEILINPNDVQAMSAYEKVKRGDVDGASFAFRVAKDGATMTREDGNVLRTVNKISVLADVGPVDYPAYQQASAEARSQFETFSIEQQAPPEERQEPDSDAAAQPDPQEQIEVESRRLTFLKIKNPKGTQS